MYGCGRVRWGAGGTGDTKARQAGRIYGRAGQDLGPMAGEISPDIMFWEIRSKVSRMGADGCRWVRVGANGCVIKGRSNNKTKRAPNGQAGRVFECMITVRKCNMLAKMIVGRREDQGEE